MSTDRERMENVIHDVMYPGPDRDDRMTWPRVIFDIAEALSKNGFGDVQKHAAQIQAVRGELDHAFFNGHKLDRNGQGVDPTAPLPDAVRASNILAALGGDENA